MSIASSLLKTEAQTPVPLALLLSIFLLYYPNSICVQYCRSCYCPPTDKLVMEHQVFFYLAFPYYTHHHHQQQTHHHHHHLPLTWSPGVTPGCRAWQLLVTCDQGSTPPSSSCHPCPSPSADPGPYGLLSTDIVDRRVKIRNPPLTHLSCLPDVNQDKKGSAYRCRQLTIVQILH